MDEPAANVQDELSSPNWWTHMDEAPRDGTPIEVWVPRKHGLRGFITYCAWHPDAGFCVDELRSPVAWRPIAPGRVYPVRLAK